MLVAAVSTAHMVDDESGLLVSKKIQLHDDLDLDEANTYCNALFHSSDGAKAMCVSCVGQLKGPTALYDDDKDYAKSPKFVADVAECMITAGASQEPPVGIGNLAAAVGLSAEFAVCSSIHGGDAQCATSVAHCGAVHWTKAVENCADSTPAGKIRCIVESHGFLGCIASRAGYERCLKSPMGVGLCMEKGLGCVTAGTATPTCLDDAETAYLAANPAQKEASELCDTYYPGSNSECLACAQAAKVMAGSNCDGEYCLKVPAFAEDMTQCMLDNHGQTPAGYAGAVALCQAAFPEGHEDCDQCQRAAARCLSLHPCESGPACLASDAWAYCFTRKMDFDHCHGHHAGVGACVAAGAHCLQQGHCGSGGAAECLSHGGADFVACHQAAVAAR